MPPKDQKTHFSIEDVQMANKYVTICSMPLVIRKMQMEATIRYHFIPTRMVNRKITNESKC